MQEFVLIKGLEISSTPKANFIQVGETKFWVPSRFLKRQPGLGFGWYAIGREFLPPEVPFDVEQTACFDLAPGTNMAPEPGTQHGTSTAFAHQADAVAKMLTLQNGARFWEMGTGKTKVALDVAQTRFDAGQIAGLLWFCPVSVREHILRQVERHLPATTMPVLVLGIESLSSPRSLKARNAAMAFLEKHGAVQLVVDEAHLCKNSLARRSAQLSDISAKAAFRMVLTGTPITHSPGDLFGIFKVLDPTGSLCGYATQDKFERAHLVTETDPETKTKRIIGYRGLQQLVERVEPAVFQILKKDCLDLPPKTWQQRDVELTPEESEKYSQVKKEILDMVEEGDASFAQIMQLITALNQISGGTHAKTNWKAANPAKMQALTEILETLPGRVVVWCQYVAEVQAIAAMCRKAGRPFNVYFGELTETERENNLRAWKMNEEAVLIATPTTGGTGIDLVESNYVVFYSNGFQYSVRVQAEDRNHRIGQLNPVTYTDLIAKTGVERMVHNCLSRKMNVSDEVRRMIKEKDFSQL